MSKRALLVGINAFAQPEWQLFGCVNDTLEMQELLKAYYGFVAEDIRILHDQEATTRGLRDGLGWLLSGYAGNDTRVFHFSSHGTQVDDQSKDESDCLDEVIVTYDHDWNRPFRDDDLKAIFDTIPPEVRFTFIADCCHSGTLSRVVGVTPRYLEPPDRVKRRIEARLSQRDARAARGMARELKGLPIEEWLGAIAQLLAPLLGKSRTNRYSVVQTDRHVLLAACQDRQTAADAVIDGTPRGAFSWALGKVIGEAGGNLTYGDLIRRASTFMLDYRQDPQLECPVELRGSQLFGSAPS